MSSLKRHEGYLMIDHRNSPGLTEEMTHAAGLPPGAGQGLFESATITCSHCQAIVIRNPDRVRERAYCSKCDRYLCDACGALYGMTKECRSIFKQLDVAQEAAAKNGSESLLLLTKGV
jgi:hypothetical protein